MGGIRAQAPIKCSPGELGALRLEAASSQSIPRFISCQRKECGVGAVLRRLRRAPAFRGFCGRPRSGPHARLRPAPCRGGCKPNRELGYQTEPFQLCFLKKKQVFSPHGDPFTALQAAGARASPAFPRPRALPGRRALPHAVPGCGTSPSVPWESPLLPNRVLWHQGMHPKLPRSLVGMLTHSSCWDVGTHGGTCTGAGAFGASGLEGRVWWKLCK